MLALSNEVLAVLNQRNRPERRAISLRAAPVAVISRAIGRVFWLAQACPVREQRPGWVADGLENGLGVDVVLNV